MAIRNLSANQYRIIYLGISAVLFSMGLYYFLRVSMTTTDENAYRDVYSKIYVNNTFPARWVLTNFADSTYNPGDSVTKGCLLFRIDSLVVKNIEALNSYLSKIKKDSAVLYILQPSFSFNSINGPKALINNRVPYFVYFVAKKDLFPENFTIMKSGAIIFTVEPGGASDRAGLRAGDVITKVNGQNFNNAYHADSILRSSKSGHEIYYEILRDGNYNNFKVKLAEFGVPIISIFFLAIFLLSLFTGTFLINKKPNLKAARLVGLSLFVFGFCFIMGPMNSPHNLDIFSIVRFFLMTLSVVFYFPIFFHSIFYFPKEKTGLLKKKWIIIIPYFLSFVYALYTARVFFDIPLEEFNQIDHNKGFLVMIESIYFLVIGFIYRRLFDDEGTRVWKSIRWSMYLFISTYVIADLIISNFQSLMIYRNIFDYVKLPIPALIPLSYLYVIWRYRLLDLNFQLRKNIQYIIFSNLWKMSIILVILIFIGIVSGFSFQVPNLKINKSSIELIDHPMDVASNQHYEKFILIIVSVISTYLLIKFRRKGLRYIDKKFYRTKFDYRDASTKMALLMESCCLQDLAVIIVEKLAELVHLKRVGVVFFKDELKVTECEFYGIKSKNLKEFCHSTGQIFAKSLKPFKGSIRVDYLPDNLKKILSEFQFQWIIPIFSRSKVLGALIVGDKLSETPFNNEDFDFLNSIAISAAVAVENAFLYEDLTRQERMKHELEIARNIQLASLPKNTPNFIGLDIAGISIPAFEVGGDFYDFLTNQDNHFSINSDKTTKAENIEKSLSVIVGDVSGKGTSAALYMSKTQGIIRTLHEYELSPRNLLIRTNQLVSRQIEKRSFISAIVAKINPAKNQLLISRAGHLPLFCYKISTGKVIKYTPKGIVMGLDSTGLFSESLEEMIVEYNTGDIFILISDGILEARNENSVDFDESRFIEVIENNYQLSAEKLMECIVKSVRDFTEDAPQYDDMTAVVIKTL
ncbi:MAG: SpoIIE family protein phosphatase [Candidatus Kapabacteria bacterium]|nr:SpoIIE family protein phosphatase [Candidatus Kapabacteria bacterium]